MEDNYSRFSHVADHYARYRPRYPHEMIDLLKVECGLSPAHVVADIGSGTGLLTELFLQHGNRVYGIEPNAEMRAAAEHHLRDYRGFTSIAATAEATTLADHSVDMITAGQAFHWFDHEAARQEFSRILVPQGWIVLVWNLERSDGSPFAGAFEQFWQKYIDPSKTFSSERKRPAYITRFFEAGHVEEQDLDNYQVCDFEALKGRVLSASRAPREDDPRYPAMLDELAAMFSQYQKDGTVRIEYDTKVLYGQLAV
jgi:ubiquinone/menaquinone biosynthesis C-methylase UbiE